MNKKLLFAAMSLVALTACTNDEFQSKQQIAQESSPIQFEVINNAFTRASMDGNKIVWNAKDGDLFTLYHGAILGAVNGYENATYKAEANEGGTATLSTPTMIKAGGAIMVWPVDTAFRIRTGNALTLTIPAVQTNIENNIPYVSDLVNIGAYDDDAPYNTEGLNRTYPVYMRPMASQLTLKADYAGTDATLATLETGDDPIEPIKVTSMDLLTAAGTEFTTEIPLQFGAANPAWNAPAPTAVPNNAWAQETQFNIGGIVPAGQTTKLTAKDDCLLEGNQGCKFLILPQGVIPAAGVAQGGVCVNTIYGKVVIANGAHGSQYDNTGGATDEIGDAWYRYISAASKTAGPGVGYDLNETPAAAAETSGENAGKFKVTSEPAIGMEQTINNYSTATVSSTTSPVQGEQVGAANTRYVKVLLTHLDMSGLHITNDKQLRDAARVWQKMGLPTVCVYLDGPEFNISQKTIKTINDINAAEAPARSFTVKPCTATTAATAAEVCNYIVITGGGEIQDLRFIDMHEDATKAKVALNAGENWIWKDVVTVNAADVASITNRGTMTNAATVTLKTAENATPLVQNNVPFINNGTWNIDAPAVLNVQFDVTNNGTVNIAKGAQYRQDGREFNTTFINEATDKPSRFGGDDDAVGVIWNYGVLASVSDNGGLYKADINNYGLIEHADNDAKTYVTTNQTTGASFSTAFTYAAGDAGNKMGRINLPYGNKDENNISVSAGLAEGFVSVTITNEVKGELKNTALGNKVNYVIIKGGVTTVNSLAQVKYIEFNTPGTEIAWAASAPAAFDGMMVLSDVNIQLGTTVQVKKAVYLGADMYVGGQLNNGTPGTLPSWTGYYGNTTTNFDTMYITY